MRIFDASSDDVNFLIDVDIKSYQYPLTHKQMVKISQGKNYAISLATEGDLVIGYLIWQHSKVAKLLRLGVKPAYRRLGTGTLLLTLFELDAIQQGFLVCETTVPEINCFPGHPDDVSLWLRHRGYKAVETKHNYTCMYGEKIDGIRFQKTFAPPK